jgi:hypothetical protein
LPERAAAICGYPSIEHAEAPVFLKAKMVR